MREPELHGSHQRPRIVGERGGLLFWTGFEQGFDVGEFIAVGQAGERGQIQLLGHRAGIGLARDAGSAGSESSSVQTYNNEVR